MTNQTNRNSKKSSVIGKRLLAFLLALALIMQPTLSSVGSIVYAEGTTEAGAAGSEPQGGTEVQQPAAEPAEPTQPAVEPSEPAPADDGSGQAASDADAQNQPASDQPAADPDEKKDETKEDEEEKFPAQSFRGSVSGLVVNVSAPEGALPEETQMKVSEVNKQQVINTIEKQTDLEVEKIRAADIAFFNKEGKEIEPKKAVSVSMSPSGLDASASKAVVHIDDSGKVEKVSASIAKSGAANFKADAFSVYVVVETVVPRLTVNFVNGSNTIATMYVKAADTAEEVEKILYDPGAGTVPAGQVFKGWIADAEYDKDSTFLSIEDVRSDAMSRAAALNGEDGEVTYYAAMFKQYTITYVDGAGITVGTDVAETPARETEASYTVNQGYTTDDTHNFEGWIVTDGESNVKGYPAGAKTEIIDGETIYYYENGTEITVTGNVKFSVDAPEGYWLIFDENGKGATYNAPRFIKAGEVTSAEGLIDMVRNGYSFKGWYTGAPSQPGGDPTGEEFQFGHELHETTTIYAKWEANTKANYTVIIWKQNVDGDGYDFEESVTISDATVGTTPNAVTTSGTDESAVAIVDGTTYAWTGFHFDNTDQAEKTVATEGNTVVNVYYNRNLITLNFYTFNWRNNGYIQRNQYDAHLEYYGRSGNGWSGYTYFRVYYYEGDWIYQSGGGYRYYYGNRYIKDGNWNTTPYKTTTGLYGASLSDNGFNWPTEYNWYNEHYDGGAVGGTRLTFLDAYLPTENTTTVNYYGQTPPTDQTSVIKFYKQNPSDNDYTLANTVTVNGGTAGTNFYISDKYNGFTAFEYSVDGGARTSVGNKVDGYYNGGDPVTFTSTLDIYFNRDAYKLNFMDGSYFDGNGNPIAEPQHAPWHEVDDITYGASLASYNKGGADYYEPDAPAGYVFEGWYLDDKCSTPCVFNTMPEGGMTVYAKWRQIQYRVFLHPNAGTDPTLDWGSDNQDMNFRVSYGGKISVPTGLRTGYEFYGWYTDAACTKAFAAGTVLNDSTVTTPYDKTTHMTDPMDKWGNGATTNGDVDRPWITREFNLYAKWSQIIVGADGIGVIYDANGGDDAPSDTKLYKDNSVVSVGAASTAPTGKVFDHWVLQTWNGSDYADTGTILYPGGTFNVLKSDAKITDATTGAVVPASAVVETGKYNYTVQLKAIYKDKETETPTHIDWYSNYGSENGGKGTLYHSHTGIKINEAVDILGAKTRPGFTFKGWTKTQGGTSADFLVWTGTGYTDADGHAASKVAADEKQPYEDLFAVWEENEVTIHYAVASDSTEMGTVDPTEETVKASTGTAAGSTATAASTTYVFDYWTVDNGTNHISENAVYVPGKENGVYVEHTYYAHFKLNEAPVTVHHYLKGTETKVADDDVSQETIGTEIDPSTIPAAESFYDTYADYMLTKDSTDPTATVTVTVEGVEIKLYYTLPLTITAKTDSKTYDGTPLNGEYTVEGALEADQAAIETALGTAPSITNVSESPKQYPTETEQTSITGIPTYYAVTYISGTLTINPKAVTITAKDASKTYDGSALTESGFTASALEEGDSHTFAVVMTEESTITNVGTQPNAIATVDGVVVTTGTETAVGNYLVTTINGLLTVNRKAVTITADGASQTYNGSALIESGFTASALEQGDGHTFTVVMTDDSTITNVGTQPNVIATVDGVAVKTGNETEVGNYLVTTADGTLTVNPKAVTITAKDANKAYDGSPLTESGFTATDLEEGDTHIFAVEMTAESTITNVGTKANVIATVDGVTVTTGTAMTVGNYTVTTVDGTLTITQDLANLVITSATNSWTYDGSLHKDETYTVTYDGNPVTAGEDGKTFTLPNEDVLTITPTAAGVTNVADNAEKNNTYTYTITRNGADTSGNYQNVVANVGTLTINAKTVTITAKDKSKTYDGSALTQPEFTVSALESGDTHTFAVEMTAESTITNVGTQGNVIATVDGVEVTTGTQTAVGNYLVTTADGTLTINRKSVTITAKDKSKTYDGSALTQPEFTVSDLESGDTHTFTVVMTEASTITNVGNMPNVIATVDGITVTAGTAKEIGNYLVTTVHGTLTVNAKEVTITAKDKSKTYDGSALTQPEFTVSALESGDTHTFAVEMTAESTITNAGTQGNVIATVDGVAVTTGEEKAVGNYLVSTVDGTLEITPKKVTITAKDAEKTYDGSPLTESGFTASALEEGDSHTFTVVMTETSTITNIGTQPNVIATVDGVAVTTGEEKAVGNYLVSTVDGTLEITPKKVTITAKDAEKTYDGSPLTESGFTASALEEGDSHTFTVVMTETSTITNVGTQPNVIATVDGVSVTTGTETAVGNYLVTTANGELKITEAEVTITAKDKSKTYDGSALTQPEFTVSGLAEGDDHEFTVVMTAESTITNIGTKANVIATVDGTSITQGIDGQSVPTKVGNYIVKTVDGTLTVNPKKVTITAKDASQVYNGSALTESGFTASALEDGDNHTFAVVMTEESTITNVGTQPNVIATVDGVAVTTGEETAVGNYLVTTVDGTLEITPKKVTITAKDKSKTYDGSALTQPEFTVNGLAQSDDHEFTVAMTAGSTITNVGTKANVIATVDGVAVTTGEEKAVGNYLVTTADGTLTINPKKVTITAKDAEKTYDGDPLTQPEFKASALESGDSHTFTVVMTEDSTITNVGTKANVIATVDGVAVTTGNETEVGNYLVTTADGTLTITPQKVTLTSNSDTLTYDGEDHTVTGFTSSVEGLTFEGVSASGGGKNAGTYDVAFSGVTVGETRDSTGNYVVSEIVTGSLTINRRAVTVTADNKTKVEGTADPALTVTIDDGWLGDDPIIYTISRVAGSAPRTYDIIITGESEQGNYTVTFVAGTFTIIAAPTPEPGPTPPTPTPTPTVTPATTTTTPATTATLTPPEVIENDPTPQAKIDDGKAPKAEPETFWALLNLLCAIATCLISVLLLAFYFIKRKADDEENEKSDTSRASYMEDDQEEAKRHNKLGMRLLGLIPAIGSVVAFILTEDMSLPMQWVDKWTLMMVIILAIEVAVAVFSKKTTDDGEEEQGQPAKA